MNSPSKIVPVTRRNFITTAAVATVGALSAKFLPVTAAAAVAVDPKQVYLQSLSYSGTGCPQGSVGTSFSNDRQSLTLIFDKYVVSTGPGVPLTESRKNCQLSLNIHVPQGFSYTVATVDYQGYVQLPTGVTAAHKLIYNFKGATTQISSGATFRGPIAKDYLVRNTLAQFAWMPCGSVVPLNVNAQASITGTSNLPAELTTSSIDGKVRIVLGLKWRTC